MEKSLNNIQGLIFDMDGVLWHDEQPITDLQATFDKIISSKYKFVFATNNATLSVDQYIQKLARFGLIIDPWQIVNSPQAVLVWLKTHLAESGPVYIIGESGLHQTLEESGYFHSDHDALAVVVGLDRNLTYSKLKNASLLIQEGIPFVGSNPDQTLPTPEGLAPGAGAILAALESSSGVKPVIVGKPNAEMYNIAMHRMGTNPQQTLVIGDRLETDIAGGQALCCRTALVLSGVSKMEDAIAWQPKPDLIITDISVLLERI